jgi:hypothetical protein
MHRRCWVADDRLSTRGFLRPARPARSSVLVAGKVSDLQPGEAVIIAKRTAVSAVAGVVFVVLSCWAGAEVLFVAGMTCDDTCAGDRPPPGSDWTQYGEAAQWSELGWLAGANILLTLVSAGLVLAGRRRMALLGVLIYGAVSVRLVGLFDEAVNSVVISWVWFLAAAMGLIMALGARGR